MQINPMCEELRGGYVSVTADGVKTYTQLFNSLYALVDMSKVRTETKLIWDLGTAKIIFVMAEIRAGEVRFYRLTIGASDGALDNITVSNSSTWYRCNLATNNSYTNRSSNVPMNGHTFTIQY